MSEQRFHHIVAMPSASLLLDNLGATLSAIKCGEGMHDRDIGDVLGKSRDRAIEAREGRADISLTSFLRATNQWRGGFADRILAPINGRFVETAKVSASADDRAAPRVLSELLVKLLRAVEDNGRIDQGELIAAAPEISQLCQLADALRSRLAEGRPN